MTSQHTPDFFHQVENFIINSVSADIFGDRELNNEIGMYLMMLVHSDKEKAGQISE